MFVYREARIANSGYEKFAVQWLNEAFLLCGDKFQLIDKRFFILSKVSGTGHCISIVLLYLQRRVPIMFLYM